MPRPVRTVKPPSAATKKNEKEKTAAAAAAAAAAATATGKKISDTKAIATEAKATTTTAPKAKATKATKDVATKVSATVSKSRTTRSTVKDQALTPTTSDPAPAPAPKPARTRTKPTTAGATTTRSTRRRPTIEPEPSPTISRATTPDPTPTPSSNAENHTPTPSSSHFRSSPPVMAAATPASGTKRIMVLEFSPDAGYSPPPTSTSAQRPRLRELQPLSLEPIEGEESEAEIEGRASPTPRRGRQERFASVERQSEGDGVFYVGADEQPFTIYSDPKSPVGLPATREETGEMDDTMRPPESSPAPAQRKRRSSGAVVNSDEDVAVPVDDDRGKRRKGKGKGTGLPKTAEMTTEELRGLLPRRRRAVRDEYDVPVSTEAEDEDEEDELARPVRRRGKAGAKGGGKGKRTYGGRGGGAEKENSEPNRAADEGEESSGDETVRGGEEGRKRRVSESMKEVVEKFKEVDKWEMEFEDVSQGSLEVSDGGR